MADWSVYTDYRKWLLTGWINNTYVSRDYLKIYYSFLLNHHVEKQRRCNCFMWSQTFSSFPIMADSHFTACTEEKVSMFSALSQFPSQACYIPDDINKHWHIVLLSNYCVILQRSDRLMLKKNQMSCTVDVPATLVSTFSAGWFDLGKASHPILISP